MKKRWKTPLTNNQQKVLDALINNTEHEIASTVSSLANKCKLPFSTTFDCLRKLKSQGYADRIRITDRERRSKRWYWIAI